LHSVAVPLVMMVASSSRIRVIVPGDGATGSTDDRSSSARRTWSWASRWWEFADAGAGGGVVHGAVLECGVVPGDCCLGARDLVGDGTEFGVLVVGAGVALGWARSIMAVRMGSAVVEKS
jgi:hypothetical protein